MTKYDVRDGFGRFTKVQTVEVELSITGTVRWTCKSDTCLRDSLALDGEATGTEEDSPVYEAGEQWVTCGHCGQETMIIVDDLDDDGLNASQAEWDGDGL